MIYISACKVANQLLIGGFFPVLRFRALPLKVWWYPAATRGSSREGLLCKHSGTLVLARRASSRASSRKLIISLKLFLITKVRRLYLLTLLKTKFLKHFKASEHSFCFIFVVSSSIRQSLQCPKSYKQRCVQHHLLPRVCRTFWVHWQKVPTNPSIFQWRSAVARKYFSPGGSSETN